MKTINPPPAPMGPIDPENFKGKDFLSELDKLTQWLETVTSDGKEIDDNFPASRMKEVVNSVTGTIESYTNFNFRASGALKTISELMTKLRKKIEVALAKVNEDYEKYIRTGKVHYF